MRGKNHTEDEYNQADKNTRKHKNNKKKELFFNRFLKPQDYTEENKRQQEEGICKEKE